MFIKTTIALALVVAAVSGAVAAPNVARNSPGWATNTDPSPQIRNYLQHDRGAE
jgi:hypothetical protein